MWHSLNYLKSNIIFIIQARNYIRSLPKMEKKNFHEVFRGASPLGNVRISLSTVS